MKNNSGVKQVDIRKKRIVSNVLKYSIFFLIAIFSYFASAYLYGYKKTNERLIILVICALVGIMLFFLIYLIAYGITLLKYSIKAKRKIKNEINCDDLICSIIEKNGYKFSYDLKKSINENLKEGVNLSYNLVKEIAKGFGSNGKYVYLDYTVYDALEIFGNAVDVVKVKADAIFSLLRIQDKPISLLEKKLTDILEGAPAISQEKPKTVMSKLNSGVKNVAGKVAIFALKGKISSLVNEIVEYVGFEAFRVFSKQNKQFTIDVLENAEVKEAKNA